MAAAVTVDVLDVSQLGYAERLVAASLQGLVNRERARLFLDHGVYDDVAARTTNEVFLPEDVWRAKYRDTVGNQDQANLDYYQETYGLHTQRFSALDGLARLQFKSENAAMAAETLEKAIQHLPPRDPEKSADFPPREELEKRLEEYRRALNKPEK